MWGDRAPGRASAASSCSPSPPSACPWGASRLLGVRVGVAAVLFAGLGFGALDPRLRLPEIVVQLGPRALRVHDRSGERAGLPALVRRPRAARQPARARKSGGRRRRHRARPAGSGSIRDRGRSLHRGDDQHARPRRRPRVVAGRRGERPVGSPSSRTRWRTRGVLGIIVVLALLQRLWRTDYAAEARGLRDYGVGGEHLGSVTVRVTRAELANAPVQVWREREGWHAILGRVPAGRRDPPRPWRHGAAAWATRSRSSAPRPTSRIVARGSAR
jgi:putative transport protein